jgi:hypothetical protein
LFATLGPNFEHERQEMVILLTVTIDLNTAHNCQVRCWVHPLVVKDRVNELAVDLEHGIREGDHLVLGRLNLANMWLDQMLNAVHLVIEVPVLKILSYLAVLVGEVSANRSSTSSRSAVLPWSVKRANLAFVVEADMWRKENQNMTVDRAVAAECVPPGLTSEWEPCKASKWEELTPSLLVQGCHIGLRVGVIDLIWASRICKQCIVIIETEFYQSFVG